MSDNAGIAIRAWGALTTYGPKLGQPSRLARGVYDPGPLQYWLLTLPAHIDPRTGVLLGAAVWCMVACSIAIEAARSAAGAAGGLLAGAALLAAILWIPGVSSQPVWNPWFGLMFFLAAIATAWAVMAGRRGWWPVLMICASIAAQAHLMYALAAAALVLVAFITGLTDTIRSRAGYRWLPIGILASLACWSAPLIQQFTAPHGNLGALIKSSNSGTGQKGGLSFGLQAVAASVQPPPLWWRSFAHYRTLIGITHRPTAVGVATLALTVAVLAIAIRPLPSRRVRAVATVSLLVSVAAMITYAAVPASNITMHGSTFNNLAYLMAPILPVGFLAWTTVISGAVIVARRFRRSAPAPVATAAADEPTPVAAATGGQATKAAAAAGSGGEPGTDARGPWTGGREHAADSGGTGWPGVPARALPALASGAVAVLLLLAALAINQNRVPQSWAVRSVNYAVRFASQQIEARLRAQPINLTVVGRDGHFRRRLTMALAYNLDTMGYRPEVAPKFAWQLGPAFTYHGQRVPRVVVHVYPGGASVFVRGARASLARKDA